MTKFIFWHLLGSPLRLWVHCGTAIIYLIKTSEQSERAVGIEGGFRGDGPDDIVAMLTPPRWMDQSGSNFQGVRWGYGDGKMSPIGQEIRNLHFFGSPVDGPAWRRC